MMNVRGIQRNMKNVVKNYSDAQVKVREATSNDHWGPSSTLMSEIADLTYNVVAFSEIMQMIWKRLNDHGKNWRHVYKALVLLEYLIKTGSEKVAQQCKENIFAIQTLKDFQYIEENKDQGMNVREKSKSLVALLKDDDKLRNERARALKGQSLSASDRFVVDTNLSFLHPHVYIQLKSDSLNPFHMPPTLIRRKQFPNRRSVFTSHCPAVTLSWLRTWNAHDLKQWEKRNYNYNSHSQ